MPIDSQGMPLSLFTLLTTPRARHALALCVATLALAASASPAAAVTGPGGEQAPDAGTPAAQRGPVDPSSTGGLSADAPATPEPAPTVTSSLTLSPATGPIVAANVPFGRLVAVTARRYGISVSLFTALIWQESGFRAKARSEAGARGLAQLMPGTAREMGVRRIYDPAQNLAGGARYLRSLLIRFRSVPLALAGYNAGPGAVTRHDGIPPFPETRRYVTRVLGIEAKLRAAGVR